MGRSGYWEPGVNEARCDQGKDHEAPAPDCECGLYAYHSLQELGPDDGVIGVVAAWGRLEVHHDGFRAERARILALARTDCEVFEPETFRHIEAVAARYHLPLVPLRQLESVGMEHGSPVPPRFRPDRPKCSLEVTFQLMTKAMHPLTFGLSPVQRNPDRAYDRMWERIYGSPPTPEPEYVLYDEGPGTTTRS